MAQFLNYIERHGETKIPANPIQTRDERDKGTLGHDLYMLYLWTDPRSPTDAEFTNFLQAFMRWLRHYQYDAPTLVKGAGPY